ncbi:MAG TPA: response regulator [Anaeromyxobacteraceae bacterium]|nr:response regulator [Anaeromyxobacteraceae bacterium]
MTKRWDRPEESDHVLVIDDSAEEHLRDRLASCAGRDRASKLGRYPRFRVIAASGEDLIAKVTAEVSVVAVDLLRQRPSGIEAIQELRHRWGDLAILGFMAAPGSEAVTALMAGADHFHDNKDLENFERALDLAIERRRLARLVEHSEAAAEEARRRLKSLDGGLTALAGFRPPHSQGAVIPFQEAARRYLQASARLFQGDPQRLAERLGVSYFALRRLLKRYGVPFPGRTRSARAKNIDRQR